MHLDQHRQLQCDPEWKHDRHGQLRRREDHPHGDGDAVRIEHHDRAGFGGDGGRQRRGQQPHADRLGDADQRRLYLDIDGIGGRQRDHQHSRRIAGRGKRHADGQLHAGCGQRRNLQHGHGRIFSGEGDRNNDLHADDSLGGAGQQHQHPGDTRRHQQRRLRPDASDAHL